jgi:hypothetical protein
VIFISIKTGINAIRARQVSATFLVKSRIALFVILKK